MWPFSKRRPTAPPVQRSAFSTDLYPSLAKDNGFKGLELPQPTMTGVAMDSVDGSIPSFKAGSLYGVAEAQAAWYANQLFIGNNLCAVIAKHWLVDKACNMPARDAIRQGYDIDTQDGQDMGLDTAKIYRKFYTTHDIRHIQRGKSPDFLVFAGRRYDVMGDADWYEQDGWLSIVCIEAGEYDG
ncbi:phage collar protein [Xenorhabdus stockiae]|uniref:phage collar protein n=1 Tax=Xenorhabdus stockiae TaxID=351614 RepID=UPI003CF90D41